MSKYKVVTEREVYGENEDDGFSSLADSKRFILRAIQSGDDEKECYIEDLSTGKRIWPTVIIGWSDE